MSIDTWFTQELFETIFPYSSASIVYTHDNKPFWTYQSFIDSIKWMNNHPNKKFHNFCNDSNDIRINKLELAAFLANTHQETGDPSLKIPYPWWPVTAKKSGPQFGPAGGLLSIIEGTCTSITPHAINTKGPTSGDINVDSIPLSQHARDLIGLDKKYTFSSNLCHLNSTNQPGFGLGTGNISVQPNTPAVSDNGTLHTTLPPKSTTDRKVVCLGTYCQYGGRGAIQLSYNYNYSTCSLQLFNDYRLVQFPNLIITTDRNNFNGKPQYFGFPGPNPNGNNLLPQGINDTTPPARMMAWITSLWFWMLPQSGKSISCHQCMLQPTKYGITSVNIIVNNQSGCTENTWAYNKIQYFKRICNILNINYDNTIICPATLK